MARLHLRPPRHTRPALTTGLPLMLTAVALAGCGSSDGPQAATPAKPVINSGQRGVLETIDLLTTASRSGDGRAICQDVFAPELAASITKAARRDCPVEVSSRLFRSDAPISVERGISVSGHAATAVIREQDDRLSTLHLRESAGRWRITAITPKQAA